MHVAAEALEAGDLGHLGADRLRGDGARRAALEAGLEVGADLELALDEVGGLDRALERLQAVLDVLEGAGLLRPRGTREDALGHVGERVLEGIDEHHGGAHGSVAEFGGDPVARVVAGDHHRAELLGAHGGREGRRVMHRAAAALGAERLEHATHATRVGGLLGVHGEAALEGAVLARERHRADGELRLRIERERPRGERERVLAGQHRADHDGGLLLGIHGGSHRALGLGDARLPRLHGAAGFEGREALDARHADAILGMHVLPRVAHLVGDPPRVDVHVGARLDAVHAALVVLDEQVVAAGGEAVDGRGLGQEPHALLEEELLVEERAHRADVGDVAGERIVERLPGEDVDHLAVAAAVHHQLVGAGHLAGEADAARAHDAAVAVEQDVRADVLLRVLDLLLEEAALPAAVLVRVVLQVALARLVAHRAVDRVVDQQELHDRLLVGHRARAVGGDHHAVRAVGLAGGLQLAHGLELAALGVRHRHLGKADPAVGRDRHGRVVAVVRDLHVVAESDLEDLLALGELVRGAVDRDLGHGRKKCSALPPHGDAAGSRKSITAAEASRNRGSPRRRRTRRRSP